VLTSAKKLKRWRQQFLTHIFIFIYTDSAVFIYTFFLHFSDILKPGLLSLKKNQRKNTATFFISYSFLTILILTLALRTAFLNAQFLCESLSNAGVFKIYIQVFKSIFLDIKIFKF